MKIGILRTNSSLPADAIARNVATALAQRGERVVQLLSSGTASDTPVQTSYPFYSTLSGGLNVLQTSPEKIDSLNQSAGWIVFEISAAESPESISSAVQKADQLFLCYEESSLSLNSLTSLLKPSAALKKQNTCPPIRAFLVTKETNADESIKKLDAACGTLATIRALYPELHGVGSLPQTPEFSEAAVQGHSIIATNPTNADAVVFAQIATDLAPGEKGNGVVRRSLKRYAKGKAPAVDSFFDLLADKLQTLFAK